MTIPKDLLNHRAVLLNSADNQPLVTFPNGLQGKAEFNPRYEQIQKAMQIGIALPVDKFPKRRIVHLGDTDFGIAFYTFYFPKMDPKVFIWQRVS